jgi:hypothetical protein
MALYNSLPGQLSLLMKSGQVGTFTITMVDVAADKTVLAQAVTVMPWADAVALLPPDPPLPCN